MKKHRTIGVIALIGIMTLFLLSGCNTNSSSASEDSSFLEISEQGTFTAGGTVERTEGTYDPTDPFNPQGQTTHDAHANVFYQIPEGANDHPLVFLHGYGQSRVGWQTTADGREGFDTIFQRKGYGVYLVDQPGRGAAGQTANPAEIPNLTQDQNWFTQFRIGLWPDFYESVQFPKDEESLNQFFRQMTPDTGLYDSNQVSDAMAGVFERSGPGVLMTHSAGGVPGWETAMKSENVEAVIAIEPGGYHFPEDELPAPIPNKYRELTGNPVSTEDFNKLIEIPIVVYFGDNIPEEPSEVPAEDFWRAQLEMARIWADVVNSHGGDVTIVHLPEEGITGNTHFMFSDLNNQEVADHIASWLETKELN